MPVGGIGNTIHAEHCPWNFVHFIRDGSDIVYRAKHVTRMRAGNQTSPLRQQRLKIVYSKGQVV